MLPENENSACLCLIGEPRLIRNGKLIRLPPRQAQIVFVLVTRPDMFASRDMLAGLLWPNGPQGRASLRQFMGRMKKQPGPLQGWLEIDEDGLRLADRRPDIDFLQLTEAEDVRGDRPETFPEGLLLEGIESPTEAFEAMLREHRAVLAEQRWQLAQRALRDLTRFGTVERSQLDDWTLRLFKSAPEAADARRFLAGLPISGTEAYRRPAAMPRVQPSQVEVKGAKPSRLALARADSANGVGMPVDSFLCDLAEKLTVFRTFAVVAPYSSFACGEDLAGRVRADYVLYSRLRNGNSGPEMLLRLEYPAEQQVVWAAQLPLDRDQLARSMQRAVRLTAQTLADAVEADIARRGTQSGLALSVYFQGLRSQLRCDLPSVRRARKHFAEAAELDPGFSLAHAKNAETLVTEWLLLGGQDGGLLQAARGKADLACSIDPGGAAGHWMGAAVAMYQRRYDRVLETFDIAEALAPHAADLLVEMADAQASLGESVAAESIFDRALDLNPAPPDRYWWFGASIALSHGDFTRAAERCDRIASDEVGLGTRAAAYALSGQAEKARKYVDELRVTLPEVSLAYLSALVPGMSDSPLRHNYREGLAMAGLR